MKKIFMFLLAVLRAPLDALDHMIEERRLVRRALVVWAAALITIVTMEILGVLGKMNEITASVTSFYLGVTALLTAVVGFYQWSRERDEKRDEEWRQRRAERSENRAERAEVREDARLD
jgi:quinol-cytochrome oxidoreductase complex cytochrome b subunit